MAAAAHSPFRDFLRLLGFVRPYLWILGIALLFAWLYGAGLNARALLLEPLLDDVALPSASLDTLRDLQQQEQEADRAVLQRKIESIEQRAEESFRLVVVAGVVLILFIPLVRFVRDYASHWIMQRLYADLQAAVGDKLVRLPLAHHVREGRGDFVARLSNDTLVANRGHSVVFGDIVQDSSIVVTALALALYVSWQLTLLLLLMGPPIALILGSFGRRIRYSAARRQEQISDVTQRLVEMLSGIKVIQAFHMENRERDSFRASVMSYFRRSMKVIRNRVLSRSLVELVTQTSFVSIVLIGFFVLFQGYWSLTPGKLIAFTVISAMLYRPVRGFATVYNTIQEALPAARRVFDVLDAAEVTPDGPEAVAIEHLGSGIRYEDVSFSYDRESVLEGVTLHIPVGQVVALVGRSGAGKTTLADLLLRFYEPVGGRILIDGRDLGQIQRRSLHELMAVVTQEAFLFDDTIAANITYGRPDATREQIEAAAHAANAHEFIEGLPEGYDTPIGELGGQLSGGQRQRLAIARAILRDPEILIFDEATSALDAKSEREVQEAIANLMRGRTVLLIAHRLSTVKGADLIAVLEDGRISMTGRHDELVSRGGLYRELVQAQLIPEPSAA